MNTIAISDWRLIRLTLDQIGPFQETQQTFSFMGIPTTPDASPGPANLYMLLAKNGYGKTTILECIHALFGLLNRPAVGRFSNPQVAGRVQADFRSNWTIEGRTETVLLSIWTGTPDPLLEWDKDSLEKDAQASSWAALGLRRTADGVSLHAATNELGALLHSEITAELGHAPTGLFGSDLELPTAILFPADRTLFAPEQARSVERPRHWGYEPAQCFGSDGPDWNSSIDNLLVWLDWLDDGRLPQLLEYVNSKLFANEHKALRAPRREELIAYVSTPTGEHDLAGLSHGERALLQFFIRTACHMTRNTILLIDEIEAHLHSKWMNRLFQAIKVLLATNKHLSVIFTTHNRELINVFDHNRPEPDLVKGGYLIEDEIV